MSKLHGSSGGRDRLRRGTAGLVGLTLVAAAAGLGTAAPAQAAIEYFNPFEINQGFTMVGTGDVQLNNGELEGSAAALGTISSTKDNYPLIHCSAGLGDYEVPVIDEDPVRVLADQFVGDGSFTQTNRDDCGTGSEAATSAISKFGDTTNLTGSQQGDDLRLTNTDGGFFDIASLSYDPATWQADVTTEQPVADYFGDVDGWVTEVNQCLADMYESPELANELTVTDQDTSTHILSGFSDTMPNWVNVEDIQQSQPGVSPTIRIDPEDWVPTAQAPLVIRVNDPTAAVSNINISGWSASPDGQMDYARYILFDVSTDTVDAVTWDGVEMGAVWSPDVDMIRLNTRTINGQYFAENIVTGGVDGAGGGEVHHQSFLGQIPCETDASTATFQIHKEITGDAAELVPGDTEFTVGWEVTAGPDVGQTGELTILADGTVVDGPVLQPGDEVTFSEPDLPEIDGVVWGDPVIDPNPLTLDDSGTVVDVAVTNTANSAPEPATFQIHKAITGDAASLVPDDTEFTVDYEVTDGPDTGQTGTLTLLADGTVVDGPALQPGDVVTFSEPNLPTIAGVAWGDPTISPNPLTLDDTGAVVDVAVTNEANPGPATFQIHKTVTGDAADLVPDDTEFTVDYEVTAGPDEGDTGTLTVLADGTVVDGPTLTHGDVIDFSEPTLPEIDGVTWGTPSISPNPLTLDATTTTVDVAVTNTANETPTGGFAVTKAIDGTGDDLVDPSTEFTVSWEVTGGPDTGRSGTLTVPADGTVVDGPQDLVDGDVVTFSEPTAPDVDGTTFEGATIDPNPITIDTSATETPVITVTNTYDLAPATFQIHKAVTGDAADLVPAGTEFSVTWRVVSGPDLGDTGTLTLLADGTVVDGPTLSHGDVVLLTEPTLPPIDGVVWGDPTITPNPLTLDSTTEPVDVAVTNTANAEPTGGFGVLKAVDGTGASLVDPSTEFTVDWEVTDGPDATNCLAAACSGTVTVLADGTLVNGPDDLRDGDVVTFSEPTAPDVDGTTFEGASIDPATVTIDADAAETPVVTVTNTYDLAPASFQIHKAVTGDAAGLVPAGTAFTVAWEVTDGPDVGQSGTLTVLADGTVVDGPTLSHGDVVEFSEPTFPVVDGVVWGDPTITPNPLTLDATTTTVDVEVSNVANAEPTGGFGVLKAVDGRGASLVDPSTEFTVDWEVTDGPDAANCLAEACEGTLTVLADGTLVNGPDDLRDGDVVTFSEPSAPDVDGTTFEGASIDPATVTIDADAAETPVVTVTNTYDLAPATFQIHKAVTGDAAGLVPADTEFTVTWRVVSGPDVGDTGTLTLLADGTVVDGPELTHGDVVLFTEPTLPSIDGVAWGDPTISPNPLTLDATTATVDVTVTNTADLAPATFTAHKVVTGDGASLVPDDAVFELTWTVTAGPDLGETGTMDLTADGAVIDGPELTHGDVVEFSEATPPAIDGVVWGDVTIDPESITLDAGVETVDVTVTNTADLAPATFQIHKAVTGDAAGLVPAETEFTVDYEVTVGPDVGDSGTLTVLADGTVVDGPELTHGDEVTFSEPTFPVIDGVVWGDPTITPNPLTLDATTATVDVSVANVANAEPTGGFGVLKAVDGTGASLVDPSTEFTVDWEVTDGPDAANCLAEACEGTLTVLADGTLVNGPEDLRDGDVITFSEPTAPDVPGTTFEGASIDPTTVTIDADAAETPVVTVTNTYDLAPGTFQIHKAVTGDAADLVPPDTEFTVDWEVTAGPDAGQAGTLTLLADGTVVDGPELTHGDVITFSEPDLPAIDGVVWGDPTISPNPLTLDATTATVDVAVTNTADFAPATFQIHKAVTGDAAGLVPDDAEFTVTWEVTDGPDVGQSGELTLLADGTVVDGPTLSHGDVVEFTEATPPAIDGVVWGDVTIDPESITLDATAQVVDVEVSNATSFAPASFQIHKAVTGDAAGLVPAGTAFTVAWEVTDGPDVGQSGTLTVLADGTVVDGPTLSHGDVVEFSEPTFPVVDGVVWGDPTITPNPLTLDATTTTVDVEVSNVANAEPTGGFGVLKAVDGRGASLVDPSTEFTVDWEVTDGPDAANCLAEACEGTLTVLADGTLVNGPDDLRDGDVVTFSEPSAPDVDGTTFEGASIDPATVTIDADAAETPVVTVTNTYDLAPVTFSAHKVITGDAADLVPDDAVFELDWRVTDGASSGQSGTLEFPADGTVVAGPTLSHGDVVELTEATPPTVDGVVWGDVTIDPASLTLDSTTETVDVEVTNAANLDSATFSAHKVLTGDAADRVPDDAVFTLDWEVTVGVEAGQSGTLELPVDGTVVAGPELTHGDVVTFTEATPPAVDGVVWGPVVIDPASLTLDSAETVDVEVTNTANPEPTGGFGVLKAIDGSGASLVAPSTEFTVDWEVTGGPDATSCLADACSGTLTVLADGTLTNGPDDLREGDVVTFSEPQAPEVAGTTFEGASIDPATVIIDPTADVAPVVTVTNTYDLAPATFSAHKVITGDGADLVPADTEFTLAWEVTSGADVGQSGELTLLADGTVVDGPDLHHGDVVVLTEATPPVVDGVVWGDAEIHPEALTLDATVETVDVTVTNTARTVPHSPGDLPSTGTGGLAGPLGLAAALLILGGGLLVVRFRSRREEG